MEYLDRLKEVFAEEKDKYLPENYEMLKKHFRKINANAKLTARTKENHYITLARFGQWCKIPFLEVTEDDILDYCDCLGSFTREVKGKKVKYNESTLYFYKSGLRRYLKDIKPELCKCLEIKTVSKVKAPSDMLTEEEIQKLIDCCLNARDRAFIAAAYESGARRNELLSVELRHVTFDNNGAVIFLPQSKTFERRVRLVFSTMYLKEWISVHPRKNDLNAPLFCSLRSPHNTISHMGLTDQLNDLQKRSGLQKHITAHLFRHSAATRMASHLTEQQMKQVLGWQPNSSMASVYVHLSGVDVDNAILKMNGVEVKEEKENALKTVTCPRCHEINTASSRLCYKCFANLDPAAVSKEIEEKEKQVEDMKKLQADLEDMKNNFEMLSQIYTADIEERKKLKKIEFLPEE